MSIRIKSVDCERADVFSDLSDEAMAREIGLYDWGAWLRQSNDGDGSPKTPLPCTAQFRAGYRKTTDRGIDAIGRSAEELEKLDRAIAALPRELKVVILALYLYRISLNRLPAALETTRHYVIIRRNRALTILYSAHIAGLLKTA